MRIRRVRTCEECWFLDLEAPDHEYGDCLQPKVMARREDNLQWKRAQSCRFFTPRGQQTLKEALR